MTFLLSLCRGSPSGGALAQVEPPLLGARASGQIPQLRWGQISQAFPLVDRFQTTVENWLQIADQVQTSR